MDQSPTNDPLKKVTTALKAIPPRKGLFLLSVLGGLFVILSVFYVWLYVQQVQFNYRLAHLYQQQELLLETQRKLRLEWARFEDPYLLEELSRERFGLSPAATARRYILQDDVSP